MTQRVSNRKRPDEIVIALTRHRGAAKQSALRSINLLANDERTLLSGLLLRALRNEFAPAAPEQTDDGNSANIRCWILSALGRVAGQNVESARAVREHLLKEREPHEWARYWALEGLVAGQAPDLESMAEGLLTADGDPLVQSLSRTILASKGNKQCLREIVDRLDADSLTKDFNRPWSALRALRVVPIANTSVVLAICSIVKNNRNSDLIFDAIVALGRVPPASAQAEVAAEALANYLVRDPWPMHEARRAHALIGLGNLRVRRHATVLLEELLDESPSIVSAASQSLGAVLGVRLAAARIVELAASSDANTQSKLAGALRHLHRASVVDELESIMLTGSEGAQAAARTMLSEVGGIQAFQKLRARTAAASEYRDVLAEAEARVRKLFEETVCEARRGFTLGTFMDVSVFFLGLALIGVSAAWALVGEQTLNAWVGIGAGGGGVLSVLYSVLIANPRRTVRRSINELMKIKVIFLAYLRQLHQTDLAYTRRLVEEREFSTEELSVFMDNVHSSMTAALAALRPVVSKRRSSATGVPFQDTMIVRPSTSRRMAAE